MAVGMGSSTHLHAGVVMLNRSLGWMLIALCLGALYPIGASAQGNTFTPLPAGVTACKFSALVKDIEPGGPPIRDAPRLDGREVGRLPAQGGELHEIQVIGLKDGWFLIEGAADPGRGWVEDKFVTTHLYRDTLKKAPTNDSPDVSHLYGTRSNGFPYQPYDLEVQHVLGCSGPWLEVEIHQPNAKTVSGKPASTADGTVRGWTDRSCTKQSDGPCTGVQFDYPWSPLPAGVTECQVGAVINDPDPAGLNVRDAPDRNARVLGRLPPRDTVALPQSTSNFFVLPKIQVIGYRKGWFLIEMGGQGAPYYDADLPPPKPYSGRGWVSASMLTAELLRDRLKQAPSEQSADVLDLRGSDKEGIPPLFPQSVKIRRMIACSGDWVHVEVAPIKGMTTLLESGAPKGAVRGWANGTCAEQLSTCDFGQDRPWSPPAPLPKE
jgi:hypothetical protein